MKSLKEYLNSISQQTKIDYKKASVILLLPGDNDLVWDLLWIFEDILFPDFLWKKVMFDFPELDDHTIEPPVFNKIRNESWLISDFNNRLNISLWLYLNSKIIYSNSFFFKDELDKAFQNFQKNLRHTIELKYLELRSERHNLRQAIQKNNKGGVLIIKATILKLFYEICFLVDGSPYPYKKLLHTNIMNCKNGLKSLEIGKLWIESDSRNIISLSDELIFFLSEILKHIGFSPDFLKKWWLYLK